MSPRLSLFTSVRSKAPRPLKRAYRRLRVIRAQVEHVRRYHAFWRSPLVSVKHVLHDRELVNFTYEIENVDELVAMLVGALRQPEARLIALVEELEEDSELRSAIRGALAARSDRNGDAPYGRRVGWYVLARVLRPRMVVETGTHDGLGSAVILRALERNAAEGFEGRLVSIDLDRQAGWLVPDWLRGRYEQRFEDSVVALATLQRMGVDLAILDSAHSYQHETSELNLVASLASRGAVVVSDNPGSGAFADFCARYGTRDHEFWEKPRRHIHPGAGLSLARL